MKIAVLGGGTAGYIAAAQFSHALPQAQLLHIHDSTLPTIGVGEGTTPRFPPWFEQVTGHGFGLLAERCGATLKTGTRFEGWGRQGGSFVNRFQPTHLIGWHFDAATVVRVLDGFVRGERIDARVTALHTQPHHVAVQLADGRALPCDYVFDARGFPRPGDDGDLLQLSWIPTGRALLRRLAPGAFSGVTRAIARPHGWVFQIPLRDWTSCGYIFNPQLSSDAEVESDFSTFLHAEQVQHWEPRGALNFPNFVRRTLFDGRVFRGGNAAAFLEPLEATALGGAIVQARAATEWIGEHAWGGASAEAVAEHNALLFTTTVRDSLFIAWHYACGSVWNTPFWRHAAQGLDRARADPWVAAQIDAMKPFIAAGRRVLPAALQRGEDPADWDEHVFPLLRLYRPFGNFSELNFAQVGHGIGRYRARVARAA